MYVKWLWWQVNKNYCFKWMQNSTIERTHIAAHHYCWYSRSWINSLHTTAYVSNLVLVACALYFLSVFFLQRRPPPQTHTKWDSKLKLGALCNYTVRTKMFYLNSWQWMWYPSMLLNVHLLTAGSTMPYSKKVMQTSYLNGIGKKKVLG